MAKKINSRPGFFGSTIHYDERGHKVGESRPGIFGDIVHYDSKGKRIGDSNLGFFGDIHTRLDEDGMK